ncbi:MAG: hypothetical protein QOE90_2399 [Thermoplasmata archaeon]|jgi:hypothetical protein|nr:hypothetical protein [Thermoplasmata archaeon]
MMETTHTESDSDRNPNAPRSLRARLAANRKASATRQDAANFDILDAVIGIFIFVSIIGLVPGQIQSAVANLTGFPGAGTLLNLVPLLLVAILVYRIWNGRGKGSARRSYR